MTRKNFLTTLFAFVAAILMLGLTSSRASAQCPGCPGGNYTVDYNYTYPPAPNGSFKLSLNFAGGVDNTNEINDGTYAYPQSPAWGPALSLDVVWPGGTPVTFTVPCPKTPVTTPWGILFVEIKCNPCIEIKISY